METMGRLPKLSSLFQVSKRRKQLDFVLKNWIGDDCVFWELSSCVLKIPNIAKLFLGVVICNITADFNDWTGG